MVTVVEYREAGRRSWGVLDEAGELVGAYASWALLVRSLPYLLWWIAVDAARP